MKHFILEDKSSGKFYSSPEARFTSNELLAKHMTREDAETKNSELLVKGISTWVLPAKKENNGKIKKSILENG